VKYYMNNQKQPSHYNHLFSYQNGLRLVYNSLSGSILELKGEEGNQIESILSRNNNSSSNDQLLIDKLSAQMFLTDQDVDELNIVKHMFKNLRLQDRSISLTILPTLGCNFGCHYCFEKHIKGLMSEDVQDALVKFVTNKLLFKTDNLSIEWFGGEPLLGISVIENLTSKFREVCNTFNKNFGSSSITTNGYLLNNRMANKLLDLGITSAQITLDGTPEIHNRRRPLVDGRGSFEHIIDNIKNAPPELKIQIRINVDSYNKDCIFDLLKYLHNENLIPRVKPYVARVESFSEECRSSEGFFLSSQEFAEFKLELQNGCNEASIPWFSSDTPKLNACGVCIVDNINGFVIEPDGKILKCWAEAGNQKGTVIAHLLDQKSWNSFTESPLQNRNPFDDPECCECKILPACMGGCPRTRENHRIQGYKECPPMRYSLKQEVLNMYKGTRLTKQLT
jgi:uncharacterized protein